MSDELLTVFEVAERLKINQQTVRNWIDRGELQATRIGRRVRISDTALTAYLRAHQSAPPAPGPEVPAAPAPATPARTSPPPAARVSARDVRVIERVIGTMIETSAKLPLDSPL